jgi:hypothetical protein
MGKFQKIFIVSLLFILMLIPLSKITYAKDEPNKIDVKKVTYDKDKGIGIENDLGGTSEEAYNTLPSDTELAKQLENKKADIAKSSNKKIGKGKGKVYDAYKDEIDNYIQERKKTGLPTNGIKKTMQNYNTETGQVEGGSMFDVQKHITNLGLKIGKFTIDVATQPLKSFTMKPSDVLDAPSAKPMKNAFNSLTDILIALFLIFQLSKIMISRAIDIGYNGQLIYDKLFKTICAVVLIGLYEPLFKVILNFQYLLVTPILKSIDINEKMSSIIALNAMVVDTTGLMVMLPFVGLMIIVVTLSLFYSLALMIILFIVGPLAITTMVNEDMEFFSLWIRKVVSRVLTLMLQSLCIAMSFSCLFRITFSYKETITDYMLGIAFLFVALGVPKLLENFGDSSGAGRSTMLVMRSMGRRK